MSRPLPILHHLIISSLLSCYVEQRPLNSDLESVGSLVHSSLSSSSVFILLLPILLQVFTTQLDYLATSLAFLSTSTVMGQIKTLIAESTVSAETRGPPDAW